MNSIKNKLNSKISWQKLSFPNRHSMCVWHLLKKLDYFIIQLIFATIHGPTTLFGIIHESRCTILAKFYLYLQYFQQKVFNFNKISRSQTNPQSTINTC